jgi:DNA phosphorothioation-dependent restriction protein DptH
MESPSSAAAAVGLGVVTAWLQSRGRLRQAVLLPVDMFPRLFSLEGSGRPEKGERRCDLVLISLRRNIVDATFIEVKWRRSHAPLEGLAAEMVLQMKMSEQAMRRRCFNEEQIDGALQRSYLANVLRFYFERSRRYQLFDPAAELSFLEHVARLEKTGLGLKASYEGYVVSLDDEPRKPLLIDDARITVLTARDFAGYPQFLPLLDAEAMDDEIEWARHTTRLLDDDVTEVQRAIQVQEPAPAEYEQRREEPSGVDPAEAILDDDVAVSLGVAASGPVEWHPSVKGSPHLFILGIPGQGKSWTTTRILMELGRQQVPALVLDFHGQFADLDGPYYRALHPTVLDAAKGLPFSPFECATGNGAGGWKVNAMAVAEIFANVANLGHIQRDIVYTTIRDAYEAHGFDDGLAEVLPRHLTYPTLAEVFGSIERKEQERHIGNVTARCRPLLEMDLFRPAENAPDLFSHIRSGLVIDLHSLDVELLQLTAGAFILRKLYKDMFHWGYANRLRLALVLDEAHRLAKDVTLPKIMKEGRKFGIAVIVASQGLNDFHPDIVNNVGTKIIFRMNHSESRKAAGFIRVGQGQDLAARIEDLAVGRAYVQTPEMKLGALVHMDSL